jgi:hypothetical protein
MRLTICASVAFVALSAMSIPVRADVMPPPGDCAQKSEGQSCTDYDGKSGACATIAYTRSFTPPGGPTQTSQSSYFGCKTGATPKARSKACSVSAFGVGSDAQETGDVRLVMMLTFGALLLRLVDGWFRFRRTA